MTPELEEALTKKRLDRNLLRSVLVDALAEKEIALKDKEILIGEMR